MPAFDLTAAAKLAGDAIRPAIFLLIKSTEGPLRMWTGFGDFPLAPDAIDTTGGVYEGLGEFAAPPVVNQLLNGTAQRVTFSLSGVSAEILALVSADAETLRSAPVHLGFSNLDDAGAPQFDPVWLWEGESDTPQLARQPGGGPRTVSLSIGTAMTGRKRPEFAFFTAPDQRRRYPTDAGLDRVNSYSTRTTVRWPT